MLSVAFVGGLNCLTLYFCVVTCSNPYLPHGRSVEIPRERGVVKAKVLKENIGATLEFLEGWGGVQTKKPSLGGGGGIFSQTTQYEFENISYSFFFFNFVLQNRKFC